MSTINTNNNDGAKKKAADCCSTCGGPTPWIEDNPHAHEANGDFCEECGHFTGIPAFGGHPCCKVAKECRTLSTLLFDYCLARDWDKILIRLGYAPEEADSMDGFSEQTPLGLILRHGQGAPLPVIQAMAEASPEVLASAIWSLVEDPVAEEIVEVCKNALVQNSGILSGVPDKGYRHFDLVSPLHHLTCKYDKYFQEVCNKLSSKATLQNVVLDTCTYHNESGRIAIRPGRMRHAFDIASILVKASYYEQLGEGFENLLILHAIAGCRDPYFEKASGFTSLVIKLFPMELVLKDKDGNCPLHIAAATVNRNMKDYDENYNKYEWYGGEEKCRQEEMQEFMDDFCKHKWWIWNHYDTAEQYAKECCDCDFEGKPNCTCVKDFEEAHKLKPDCKCHEAFEYYYTKMEDEHRADKQAVIEAFLGANPMSASLQNNLGQLPIHLAVAEGKKCWEGGVQKLAEACPDGVGMLDTQTKLLPFMAAAAGHSLDTCFELLRFRPDVLVNFSS